MNDQSLFGKIGTWFRRGSSADSDISMIPANGDEPTGLDRTHPESRSTFLRPWAKRDAAIQQLQDGFTTLTDLMSGIRENLAPPPARPSAMLTSLSSLPQVLEQLPESNRDRKSVV